MGFFSQDCNRCGHPLLSIPATTSINRWMNDGVAISPQGSVTCGSYDGYGELDGTFAVGDDATVWHRACWSAAGEPADYRGASRHSADQGWFFDDSDHAMSIPRTDQT